MYVKYYIITIIYITIIHDKFIIYFINTIKRIIINLEKKDYISDSCSNK